LIEEKKIQEEKEISAINEPPQIKYLELTKAEESEVKNKIYNKVYENFLKLYQGN
jgi:hypothetical protein